jgi:hypothetical protein
MADADILSRYDATKISPMKFLRTGRIGNMYNRLHIYTKLDVVLYIIAFVFIFKFGLYLWYYINPENDEDNQKIKFTEIITNILLFFLFFASGNLHDSFMDSTANSVNRLQHTVNVVNNPTSDN